MIAAFTLALAISSSDAQFVRGAMEFDNGELSRATVAVDSTNVTQRQYAERISTDIQTASLQLITLARHYDVRLDYLPNPAAGAPASAEPASGTNVAKMRMLAGSLAPRRYFQTEIAQQQAAIGLFAREARSGGTAALRSFAQTTLTTIRHDLALAQRSIREER